MKKKLNMSLFNIKRKNDSNFETFTKFFKKIADKALGGKLMGRVI